MVKKAWKDGFFGKVAVTVVSACVIGVLSGVIYIITVSWKQPDINKAIQEKIKILDKEVSSKMDKKYAKEQYENIMSGIISLSQTIKEDFQRVEKRIDDLYAE